MANHASRGRARRIQSRTKLFVCPTAFAAPAYRDPTILNDDNDNDNDNDDDDEDGSWKSELEWWHASPEWGKAEAAPLEKYKAAAYRPAPLFRVSRANAHHGKDCGATQGRS